MRSDYLDDPLDGLEPNPKRRGKVAAAISLGLIAGAGLTFSAFAQETHRWNHETHVTIQETTQPGAVAEVVFLNSNIHTQLAEQFDLTLGDITVTVIFRRDVDMDASDSFTVIPPAGFIAYPESLIVPDNGAGVIYIMDEGLS